MNEHESKFQRTHYADFVVDSGKQGSLGVCDVVVVVLGGYYNFIWCPRDQNCTALKGVRVDKSDQTRLRTQTSVWV